MREIRPYKWIVVGVVQDVVDGKVIAERPLGPEETFDLGQWLADYPARVAALQAMVESEPPPADS